ncbi:MAG TPA: RICIN domain-containing protein, partial [Ktedonobacteraceae bacterium]|nr:RICIN domain-containing protein [Ktedonobacteraceae bacterium]
MKKRIFSSLVVVLFIAIALIPSICLAAGTTTTTAIAKSTRKPHIFSGRDSAGAKPAAKFASAINPAVANPYSYLNSSYHGGQVMTGVMNVYLIFWEPGGNVSAQYHGLIEQYFSDVSTSPFYQNLKQYTDAQGAFPEGSQIAGTWIDSASYPATAGMPANTIQDSDIENEVYHAQSVNSWPTGDSHSLFFVFLQKDEGLCVDSALTSCTPNVTSSSNVSVFCAYHTYGTVNTSMLYAAIPYSASPSYRGDCTPTAPHSTPVGSTPNGDDADLTLSVVAHEQMEAATDPYFDGWYNPMFGYEIADTCAWTYGPNNDQGADVVWNNHGYTLQQIWSNALASCIIADGYTPKYYALKNHNSSLVMDVYKGGTNAGAQVIQYANHSGANQQWELVPNGPFFQIANRKSGLVLDVYQASKNQGNKVVQYTNKQGLNQQWYLVPDGLYDQIVNVNSGLVLDVYKGGTNSGAQVIQYTSHNGT